MISEDGLKEPVALSERKRLMQEEFDFVRC